jgi:hypothetical protein
MALKEEKSTTPAAVARVASSAPLLPIYLASLALVFLGERVVSSDSLRYALSGLGVLGAAATTALRFARAGAGDAERQRAEGTLARLSAGGLVALGIYFTTTDTARKLLGVAAAKPETRARIEGATSVGFVALLLIAVLPLIMGELALAPMRRAERIEARRVGSAIRSGLILAFAVLYTSLFTYAAGELDAKVDFSYYRTARPSESTKNVAASAGEPIEIKAFFPQLNEVGTEVHGYLKEIAAAAPQLKVSQHDRLLSPAVAKEAKVTGDGMVVLSRGASRETLNVGADMKASAGKLKTLDADFQKALLKVLREAHVAYFTVGHGELNEAKDAAAAEGHTAKGLRKLFESQNYTVKDLGLTQGLGSEIPADATAVAVLGPTQALLPEEVAALQRYADRGGHLLLGLDPDAKVDHRPLAAAVGIVWSPTPIAHEKPLVRRRFNNSDRAIIVTNRFSSHASVSTVSRNSARMPVVFPGASSLEKGSGDHKVDFAVKSLGDVFEDRNGNLEKDADEKRAAFNVAAAVSRPAAAPAGWKGKDPPELRAFVIADADALSDAAFGNEPNIFFAADVLRWLGGEESFSGAITNNEDVRIEHTKQKDQVWFYATILGAPGLVLGVGLVITRRRKRTARAASPSGGSAPQARRGEAPEPAPAPRAVSEEKSE